MKTIFVCLAVMLIRVLSLHAQKPVQDTIPQLQEWWRADNMMYGKDGMTWLDNFYHGKGVLVVSTPNGVQSWQMRFPGDTENVFTWSGGSAAIKMGDFNGDGITDYIDEKGNIYEGQQKGEPPKPEVQTPVPNFKPTVITDVNGDGYTDMLTPGSILFGKASISDIKHEKLYFPEIDSNNAPLSSYMASSGEMRVICRQFYWTNLTKFPFQKVYKEGLRLVRIWWDGSGFKSQKLDEFTIGTNDSTGILYTGALLSQPPGKNYFICATMIKGTNQHTDVNVYDISDDRLTKLYSTQIDRISALGILQRSIDNDSLSDWFISYFPIKGYSDIEVFSGDIQSKIQSIGKYSVCQLNLGLSLPLPDGYAGMVFSGNHELYALPVSCFRVVRLPNSVGGISELNLSDFPFYIESITPQPVTAHQTIQIQLSSPVLGEYEISLYDILGKKLPSKSAERFQLSGEQILFVNIGDYAVSSGVYTLRLESQSGLSAQCSVVIE